MVSVYKKQTWMDPIKTFLSDETLPNDPNKARKLCLRVARYALIDDKLYKRSCTLSYLRCLTSIETEYALGCVQHLGDRALAFNVLR